MKKNMCEKLQKQAVRKLLRALLLLTGLLLGTGIPKMQARAAETLISCGNLVYEGKQGNAGLYAADILLLEEKISTVPEQCFDPADYAHTYDREYDRIREGSHILTFEAADSVNRQTSDGSYETTDISDEQEAEEASDEPDTSDESETEEAPDTPDESGAEEAPDTPDESRTEEAPDTPDESRTEEPPDTPEAPGEPETEEPSVIICEGGFCPNEENEE